MLIPTIVLASFEDKLLNDINSTYSNQFYKNKYDNTSAYKDEGTFEKIKTDVEKILPMYVYNENLFKGNGQIDNDRRKLKFVDFLNSSLIYMDYLERMNRGIEAQMLMDRHLANINALMTHSNDLLDYIVSIVLYQKIYFHRRSPSKNMLGPLLKYQIADKSIFFKKLDAERERALLVVSQMDTTTHMNTESYNVLQKNELMSKIRESASRHINIYFDELAFAIKSESQTNKDGFYKYIKEENNSFTSPWGKTKLMFNAFLLEINYYLFDELKLNYPADSIGKTIALASVPSPKIYDVYSRHDKIIKKHEQLLRSIAHGDNYTRLSSVQTPVLNKKVHIFSTEYKGLKVGSSTLSDVVNILGTPLSKIKNINNINYKFGEVDVTIQDATGRINTIIIYDPKYTDVNGYKVGTAYDVISKDLHIYEPRQTLLEKSNGVIYWFKNQRVSRIVYAAQLKF
jgi:hypothetical protein